MTALGFLSQLLEIVAALLLAPLLTGWVNQCRAWLQNKSAPSLLQPYRTLHKLFNKESVLAEHASPLFRGAPYVLFGCMTLASGIVPTISTELPLSPAADAIALVGLFALARVFISLAAMDIGTSFGTLGARREMLIGFLAEPAMLMILFTAAFISGSTQLNTIVETLAHREFAIYPSLAFAAVAFLLRTRPDILGENSASASAGRGWIPVGVLVALVVVLLSPLASANPDGLNRVAMDLGFIHSAQTGGGPFAGYSIPLLASSPLARILAGALGVAVVLGVGLLTGRSLRRRHAD